MKITKILCIMSVVIWIGPLQNAAIAMAESPSPVDLVTLESGSHLYRASGAFLENGHPVDAPMVSITISKPLKIMKYQVSVADYSRCVSDATCGRPFGRRRTGENSPVTGVSFLDVQNYIKWLSEKTGYHWRLPTDFEWSYAAGSRFFDDALGGEAASVSDPSVRMLAQYKKSAELSRLGDGTVKVRGSFGANENGIYDFSGSVWEWTSTCFTRTEITRADGVGPDGTKNCSVRVVEGRHRAYMPDFIQDARSGGCSVGAPPDHLGFRLVREAPLPGIINKLRNWLGARGSVGSHVVRAPESTG
jgi:formylglycine-generating enzyme required for sulfatase activity